MPEQPARRPPFATGELVTDYTPLFKYLERAKELGRQDLVDKCILTEDDFNFVARLTKSSPSMTLLELINALKVRFADRVDPQVAAEALGTSPQVATELLTSVLAGWLVEAAKSFFILGLKYNFKLPES